MKKLSKVIAGRFSNLKKYRDKKGVALSYVFFILLFLEMSFFSSCYDVTGCETIITPDVVVHLGFAKFQSIYIAQITEDNMDSVVLSCHFSCYYLRFISRDKEPKSPPADRIPEVTAKVTSEKGGDTEYYELYWDNSYRAYVFSNGVIGVIPIFAQKSSILSIVYDTNKATTNDGILSVSPEGDRLIAEIIYQNKKYTDTIDVQPKSSRSS